MRAPTLFQHPDKLGEKRCHELSYQDSRYLAESWTGGGGRTFVYKGDHLAFWIEGADWPEVQLLAVIGVFERIRDQLCQLLYSPDLHKEAG